VLLEQGQDSAVIADLGRLLLVAGRFGGGQERAGERQQETGKERGSSHGHGGHLDASKRPDVGGR
jgi:hypothetical protein